MFLKAFKSERQIYPCVLIEEIN